MKPKKQMLFSALTSIAAVFFLAGTSLAKENGGERTFPGPKMTKELKLTDDQVKKMKEIHEKNKDPRMTAKKQMKESLDGMVQAIQAGAPDEELKMKFEAKQTAQQQLGKTLFDEMLEMRKVLTDDQKKKFRGFVAKKREKVGKRMNSSDPLMNDDDDFDDED